MKLSVFYANILDAVRKNQGTLAEVLAAAKNAGIEYLDLDFTDIKNGLPEEIKNSGLGINSIYAFFDFCAPDAAAEARRTADFAAECGACLMLVQKTLPESELAHLKAAKSETEVFSFLDGFAPAVNTAGVMEEIALYAESRGIAACIENFDSAGSFTERKNELKWLFKKAPHLKFNLDTGNSIICGEDVNELFSLFSGRTVNIHCKDREFKGGKYKCCPVGRGLMPIKEIRDTITADGYTGGFSIEVFGVKNPLEAITLSAEYLLK